MLKDILRAISDSGMVSMSEIADKAGTTESMIEQAITVLVSKGYLAVVNANQNCETYRCPGCSSHCVAKQSQSKNAYLITEKGQRYLGIDSERKGASDKA